MYKYNNFMKRSKRKHNLILCTVLLCFSLLGFGQQTIPANKYLREELKALSIVQQQQIQSLPELKLPAIYINRNLPYAVDNSIQPYMRSVFNQSGLDCGQAAAVAIGFTYEINRLRGVPSNQLNTTYPSYFVWNWENGGNGWYGASYYHSMEVLRMVGTPNLEIYGEEVNGGDASRFMTGYDNYLHAMTNRIEAAYNVDVSDEDGLMNFKHWLSHHHEGSDVGGVAFFYSQYQSPQNVLPAESHHAGESVILEWGASPNHAMAILGYNDSIKYDYNGDGEFTNHIDITNDGIVDLRDWEIGAVKIANTYHSYPDNDWGENGYSWMMYRTLALGQYNGGIWNQTVNVLRAKANYQAQLTMKIKMKHTQRSKVKMNVGMTTDLDSDEPMYIIDYPIFDFQGDEQYMQGGFEDGDDDMELGFDLTPFLNYLEPGQEAKYIFQLQENDPTSTGLGFFNSMSVFDYSGTAPVETNCGISNQPLVQNGLLKIPIVYACDFQPPQIVDEDIPVATVYEEYSHSLQAQYGTPPYRWAWDMDFEVNIQSLNFPVSIGTEILDGEESTVYELPFGFPFYDSVYSNIYVHSNGFIMMDNQPINLPYNSDDDITFYHRKMIAAMFVEENGSLNYPVVSVMEAANYVHILWKSTSYEFAIRLYDNGNINIYYGENDLSALPMFVAGVSSGKQEFAQLLGISNANDISDGFNYSLTAHHLPDEFEISEDGIIRGVPTQQYLAEALYVKVTDQNNLVNRKAIPISTDGFIINYSVNTTNNDSLEVGEIANLNINLLNETGQSVTGVSLSLECNDVRVSLTDDEEFVGDLSAGQSVNLADAFSFLLNYQFEDGENIDFTIHVDSDQANWQRPISEKVFAPKIVMSNAEIMDGDNGRFDAGETVNYLLTLRNSGHSAISNAEFDLVSDDPYLTINQGTAFANTIFPEQSTVLNFNLTADATTPDAHVIPMTLYFHNEFIQDSIQLFLSIGLIIEDWETGDMNNFSWFSEGDSEWWISNDTSYNGSICLESGDINDSEQSVLKIGVMVLSNDSIRFHRKVSCEQDVNNTNWDYLAFYIDGVERSRWDGLQEWEQFSYPVQVGYRIFEWKYIKDASVSANEDCAWIDDIIFPSLYDAPPQFVSSLDSINKTMRRDTVDTDTLLLSNLGGGIIGYKLMLRNLPEANTTDGRSIAGSEVKCSEQFFVQGDSVIWNISVTNGSQDSEWIKQITLNFPAGFNLTAATDFYDSNDTLVSNGILGDGVIITWTGENDDAWGVITGGETAQASISGKIADDFEGDIEIEYQLIGDVYGEEPHFINDVLIIENLGPPITWLQLSSYSGQLSQIQSDSIFLHWNTANLNTGMYYADLFIYLEYDTIRLPVQLEILPTAGISLKNDFQPSIFPNPAYSNAIISTQGILQDFQLDIYNIHGCLEYRKLFKGNQPYVSVKLDDMLPGTYVIQIRTASDVYRSKFVKM
jgi:hypothetical protein